MNQFSHNAADQMRSNIPFASSSVAQQSAVSSSSAFASVAKLKQKIGMSEFDRGRQGKAIDNENNITEEMQHRNRFLSPRESPRNARISVNQQSQSATAHVPMFGSDYLSKQQGSSISTQDKQQRFSQFQSDQYSRLSPIARFAHQHAEYPLLESNSQQPVLAAGINSQQNLNDHPKSDPIHTMKRVVSSDALLQIQFQGQKSQTNYQAPQLSSAGFPTNYLRSESETIKDMSSGAKPSWLSGINATALNSIGSGDTNRGRFDHRINNGTVASQQPQHHPANRSSSQKEPSLNRFATKNVRNMFSNHHHHGEVTSTGLVSPKLAQASSSQTQPLSLSNSFLARANTLPANTIAPQRTSITCYNNTSDIQQENLMGKTGRMSGDQKDTNRIDAFGSIKRYPEFIKQHCAEGSSLSDDNSSLQVVVFRDRISESTFFKSILLSHFLTTDIRSHSSFSLNNLRLNVELNQIAFQAILRDSFISETTLRDAFLKGVDKIMNEIEPRHCLIDEFTMNADFLDASVQVLKSQIITKCKQISIQSAGIEQSLFNKFEVEVFKHWFEIKTEFLPIVCVALDAIIEVHFILDGKVDVQRFGATQLPSNNARYFRLVYYYDEVQRKQYYLPLLTQEEFNVFNHTRNQSLLLPFAKKLNSIASEQTTADMITLATKTSVIEDGMMMNTHYTNNNILRSPSNSSYNNNFIDSWKEKPQAISETSHQGKIDGTPLIIDGQGIHANQKQRIHEKRALTQYRSSLDQGSLLPIVNAPIVQGIQSASVTPKHGFISELAAKVYNQYSTLSLISFSYQEPLGFDSSIRAGIRGSEFKSEELKVNEHQQLQQPPQYQQQEHLETEKPEEITKPVVAAFDSKRLLRRMQQFMLMCRDNSYKLQTVLNIKKAKKLQTNNTAEADPSIVSAQKVNLGGETYNNRQQLRQNTYQGSSSSNSEEPNYSRNRHFSPAGQLEQLYFQSSQQQQPLLPALRFASPPKIQLVQPQLNIKQLTTTGNGASSGNTYEKIVQVVPSAQRCLSPNSHLNSGGSTPVGQSANQYQFGMQLQQVQQQQFSGATSYPQQVYSRKLHQQQQQPVMQHARSVNDLRSHLGSNQQQQLFVGGSSSSNSNTPTHQYSHMPGVQQYLQQQPQLRHAGSQQSESKQQQQQQQQQPLQQQQNHQQYYPSSERRFFINN